MSGDNESEILGIAQIRSGGKGGAALTALVPAHCMPPVARGQRGRHGSGAWPAFRVARPHTIEEQGDMDVRGGITARRATLWFQRGARLGDACTNAASAPQTHSGPVAHALAVGRMQHAPATQTRRRRQSWCARAAPVSLRQCGSSIAASAINQTSGCSPCTRDRLSWDLWCSRDAARP